MKKKFKPKKIEELFFSLLLSVFFFVSFSAEGNNIRINAPVKVSAGTGDTLVLEFPLQWDNSWRDEFNWDAAWVFLKYKVGTGDWKHVPLSFGGHSFNGSSGQPVHFDYMPGQTGSNTLGLFVYRSKPESGNTPEIICKLKCLKSALGGMDAGKFDSHEAFIRAQAIEMVYVPYGAYYLGDNTSNRSFTGIEKTLYGSIPESSDIVNNTSGYTITASHAYYPALNAADHQNNSVYPTGSWYTNTAAANWWKIDFKTAKTVRYFGVSGATNYPTYAPNGVWYLEGSNDNAAWTTLSAVDPGVWRATTTSYPVQQSIRVADPGAYRYYRLNFPKTYYTMVQNIAMTEGNLFAGGMTSGDLVDSESARSFLADGSDISIPAAFPKGYKGFYTMKYELSQEQYVAFLNTLSSVQQKERIPGLASMKEGDYIFGDRTQPSNRNGICVAVASFDNQPVIFANNLTNDGKYAQDNDGKTIACNYLSPNDMLGYCSWSGLRPMSEMEYEKACRPTYPDPVVVKGYAWNTTTVPGRLSSVSNGGQRNEVSGTSGANVNAGNRFGPVRCGLFATSASNQQTAGVTFWGVMEMSGNLRELCYNVNAASTFNGNVLGDGTYAVNKWNNTVGNFGVRGGGFTSGDDLLRISDRTETTGYFTSLEQRDSTVTFRGVRDVSGINIDAGEIMASDTACWGGSWIKSRREAKSPDINGITFNYLWYVKKPGASSYELVPEETGEILLYKGFENKTTAAVSYFFKRMAVCSVGDKISNEVKVTLLPEPFVSSGYNVNAGSSFTIAQNWGKALAKWSSSNANWAYASAVTANSLTMSGGFAAMTVQLEGVIPQCPSDIFSTVVNVNGELAYSGNVDSVLLAPGNYKIECWGAQGGLGTAQGAFGGTAGLGGYSYGEIILTSPLKMYVYTGGVGGNARNSGYTGGLGGWNGGGAGGSDGSDDEAGGGGGGASDVRLVLNDLNSRIMVAGGGGGVVWQGTYRSGGGGLTSDATSLVAAATQTSGNALGQGGVGSLTTYVYVSNGGNIGGGGGGGGYYGGFGGPLVLGSGDQYNQGYGSGGSGYVSGMPGCSSHSSGFSFRNAVMQKGVRTGNGQVKITPF